MKMKNLPKEVQNLVRRERIGITIECDDDIAFSHVIDWERSKDGFKFWELINQGVYTGFEERYGALKSSIDNFSII